MPLPYSSRRRFVVTAPALALAGVSLLTELAEAAANADPADVALLNSGIELERAGIKAYTDAAATGLLTPGVLKVALGFRSDHSAHRDALISAIRAGNGVVTDGTLKLDYPPLKTQADILQFALHVEHLAATKYLTIIPTLKDRDLAKAAGSILGIETTHVTLLAQALGQPPYPQPFVE
ncbi:MAG: ferritin-like domain-containing protein [Vulcanimicrobiaceae bacterium]